MCVCVWHGEVFVECVFRVQSAQQQQQIGKTQPQQQQQQQSNAKRIEVPGSISVLMAVVQYFSCKQTATNIQSNSVLGLCKKSAYVCVCVVTSQADKLRFFGKKQAGQSTQLIDSKSNPKSILNVSHIVISLLKIERDRK